MLFYDLNDEHSFRYTAITSDPDDFEQHRFFLRQNIYGRTTELFICITMYNVSAFSSYFHLISLTHSEYQEDEILLCRTLYGVMKNIAHLVSVLPNLFYDISSIPLVLVLAPRISDVGF